MMSATGAGSRSGRCLVQMSDMLSYQRPISGLGIGGHVRPYRGVTDVWITPPEIVAALGHFDLDPCAADPQPFPYADQAFTEHDDGLAQDWGPPSVRVWLNSPYGPETQLWLARMVRHGNGIALVFARTETKMWFESVWREADAVLFIQDRLTFLHQDGTRAEMNAGGPSALIAYGEANVEALLGSGIGGVFTRKWTMLPWLDRVKGVVEPS